MNSSAQEIKIGDEIKSARGQTQGVAIAAIDGFQIGEQKASDDLNHYIAQLEHANALLRRRVEEMQVQLGKEHDAAMLANRDLAVCRAHLWPAEDAILALETAEHALDWYASERAVVATEALKEVRAAIAKAKGL